MAPPLLLLKDIHLTFGSSPLLDGAELSISPGARLCLVGRNGSGKSTLLKIAAGLIEPGRGSRFVQPSTTIRYLPQEPDFSGFATTGAFVAAGLAAGDDPNRARLLLESLGLTGEEEPHRLSGGESRRAATRPRARPRARYPHARRADQSSRREGNRGARGFAQGHALGIRADQPRPPLPGKSSRATVWLDRGATRRLDKGFGSFEDWRDRFLEEEETARHKLDRRIVQEEHWLRYGVSARRKRNVRRLDGLISLREQRRHESWRARKAT